MGKKKGVGRGLEAYEVALMKNMRNRGMTRDFIMSLILRPGRTLTPAAISEVMQGKIGPDIDEATDAEADAFIQKRMNGVANISPDDLGSPTSQTVVLEVLRAANKSEGNAGALESRTLEFKEELPKDKAARCAIAKTIAAYANTGGGYVIFGISDDRTVVGISKTDIFSKYCDQISDIVTESFSPAVRWDKNVVQYKKKILGVIYVQKASDRPVVAVRDSEDIKKSTVYFRYEGKTQRIEPGDLLQMLSERDRLVAAAAVSSIGDG